MEKGIEIHVIRSILSEQHLASLLNELHVRTVADILVGAYVDTISFEQANKWFVAPAYGTTGVLNSVDEPQLYKCYRTWERAARGAS